MKRIFPRFFAVSLFALHGCAPAPGQSGAASVSVGEAADAPEPVAVPASAAFANLDTSISVKDLMNAVINVNARQLWNGVSYVESAAGVVEKIPQTQEDWDALKANAIALVEGSNALMLPGRKIDTAQVPEPRPDFQYMPAEIEQLIRADPDTWLVNLQTMQDSVLETMDAINRKDIFAFTERGAAINESCEACHAQYWYKPLAMAR